jgi:membrane-associated phospholipid phosphatase
MTKHFGCKQMALVSLLVLLNNGCGTLPSGRGWGQDALTGLEGRKIAAAAYNAFMDVQTLVPAVGAIIFTINDFDGKVSDWATDHNPVFGSKGTALNFGDAALYTLYAETAITALATPSGDDSDQWIKNKAKGVMVELAAMGLTSGVSHGLKYATGRNRPDHRNDPNTFPSAHTSAAFSSSTLSNRNINSLPLSKAARLSLQITNLALATSIGWSRVESGKHYPSDVLAGAALGHFVSAFVHDAFLGLPEESRFGLVILAMRSGASTRVTYSF